MTAGLHGVAVVVEVQGNPSQRRNQEEEGVYLVDYTARKRKRWGRVMLGEGMSPCLILKRLKKGLKAMMG